MAVPHPVTLHWILGWVFDLFFVGSGLGFIVFGARSRAVALRSLGWPRTPGRVVSSTVAEQSGGDGFAYRAKVCFTYEVDGISHQGSRIRAGHWLYVSGSGAQRTADRYPLGASVEVAYDPADPASSFLEPGETGSAWGVVAFGGIFVALGGLFGIFYALYPEGHTW